MKYFTMAWWSGVQELQYYDPLPDFQTHLATIREFLPPDLLALQESISLHDASVCEIALDVSSATLIIKLNGDNGEGNLRQFELTYKQLVSFHSTADHTIGLPGPHGYGDLGYDETDVLNDGRFEHCLLFSTGIEMTIVFGQFQLKWTDAV